MEMIKWHTVYTLPTSVGYNIALYALQDAKGKESCRYNIPGNWWNLRQEQFAQMLNKKISSSQETFPSASGIPLSTWHKLGTRVRVSLKA